MKNSKLRRVLLLMACAVLLVCLSVGATLAYLTSTTSVVENTFTVGNVTITLDETKVDEDGVAVTPAERTLKNSYKLQPNQSYTKDPTVHVQAKSEDCFVRVRVTIDYTDDANVSDVLAQLALAFPTTDADDRNDIYWTNGVFNLHEFVSGWKGETWQFKSVNGTTYEFWYIGSKTNDKGAVPYSESITDLEPLFTTINMPDTLTNNELAKLAGLEINVIAHAIQADGFADATTAWAAWDTADKD